MVCWFLRINVFLNSRVILNGVRIKIIAIASCVRIVVCVCVCMGIKFAFDP